MNLQDSTRSVIAWLRAGQTAGQPYADCASSVLVLERDRLSDGELAYVTDVARVRRFTDPTDVAVEITRVLDSMPHPDDVHDVFRRLRAA